MTSSDRSNSITLDTEAIATREDEGKDRPRSLLPEDLQLQQLLQTRFWQDRSSSARNVSKRDGDAGVFETEVIPDQWQLTRGLLLHEWQQQCIDAWFGNAKRGVIKVVTGAGKTILALAIAERLQQVDDKDLRVAIVVPTIVLLDQWREELSTRSNLPSDAIGVIGAGNNDTFNDRIRVLICVLNSASKKLPDVVAQSRFSQSLLLIVDECHRAGAAEMKRVFQTRRAYSLGLSATPEREDDPLSSLDTNGYPEEEESIPKAFEETILGQELGEVIYEMNYAQAIELGILPPFRIVHYGLSLSPNEMARYEHISREIKDLRADLETRSRKGLALIRWCRSKAATNNPKAARFVGLTSERKRLLYSMEERSNAVLQILNKAFQENPQTKAILFHESIDEVMSIFNTLRKGGYSVVAEHSLFPDQMRAESLRLFRKGTARVIVSAKSLIEGFNVPSADLGIVVAASSSVRQRIQTLGRLLRRSRGLDGSEKHAALYVLYATKTVDELIYEKADWENFVGADRNEYYSWPDTQHSEPLLMPGPPRSPLSSETALNASSLVPGQVYPGNVDEGRLHSIDTQGTIRDEDGNLIVQNTALLSILSNSHKSGGRFRVTPINHFVIELEKTTEGWQGLYLGRLETPIELARSSDTNHDDARTYSSGEAYPLGNVKGKVFSVLQRDKRLIAKKTPSGIRFVVPAEHLPEPQKQSSLRGIQNELARAYAKGHRINKVTVTALGHVVYVFNNEAYFVGYAPEGADGFVFEEKS